MKKNGSTTAGLPPLSGTLTVIDPLAGMFIRARTVVLLQSAQSYSVRMVPLVTPFAVNNGQTSLVVLRNETVWSQVQPSAARRKLKNPVAPYLNAGPSSQM